MKFKVGDIVFFPDHKKEYSHNFANGDGVGTIIGIKELQGKVLFEVRFPYVSPTRRSRVIKDFFEEYEIRYLTKLELSLK